MDFKGNLGEHMPIVELKYSKNYHTSISIATYETIYKHAFANHWWVGKKVKNMIQWDLILLKNQKIIIELYKTNYT